MLHHALRELRQDAPCSTPPAARCASKRAALHGELRVNGERVGKASEAAGVRLAYLQQEDIFYAQM